jgi:hypothetical protein
MPHEYLLRVHREGERYTASVRELRPGQHPEMMVSLEESIHGHPAENPMAAMVSAIATARIPAFAEPRRSRYAC